MPIATPILASPEQYLASNYNPDVEYVDGELVQRSVPDTTHSRLQGLTYGAFLNLESAHDVVAFVEVRMLVSEAPSPTYRVPDVCLVQQPVKIDGPLVKIPLIVVEIMSPTDFLRDFIEKCLDYARRGVPHIWIVDPNGAIMFWRDRSLEISSSTLMSVPELGVEISFDAIFQQMNPGPNS